MSRKCRACKRVIRERDRRDLMVFGSFDTPCETVTDGACRWCAPGDGDPDVDAMALDAAEERRLAREGL